MMLSNLCRIRIEWSLLGVLPTQRASQCDMLSPTQDPAYARDGSFPPR